MLKSKEIVDKKQYKTVPCHCCDGKGVLEVVILPKRELAKCCCYIGDIVGVFRYMKT